MQEIADLPVNVAFVLRAEDLAIIKDFLERLDRLVAETPGLRPIYRNVSADRLWIKRGDES